MKRYAKGQKAWGICGRSGRRMLLKDMVFDGRYPNMRVDPEWYEAKHPQEFIIPIDDPVALWRPSPEINIQNASVRWPVYNVQTGVMEGDFTFGFLLSGGPTISAGDTIPDQFTFTDVTGAAASTAYTSNEVIITGINQLVPISITGGTYSINNGAFTSSAGFISGGDRLRARLTTGTAGQTSNAVVTVNGVSDTYTVVVAGSPLAATDYDSINNYAENNVLPMTGLTNGKQGTIQVVFRADAASNMGIITMGFGGSQDFCVSFTGSVIRIIGGAVFVDHLDIRTSALPIGGWYVVTASWDLANNLKHLYVNDVSDINVVTFNNSTINYATNSYCGVGAFQAAGFGNRWNGCLSQISFNPTYIDLSNTTNRRKFIDSSGLPVDLTVSQPFGTASGAMLYMPNGRTQVGTGGGFTYHGSAVACSTVPGFTAMSYDGSTNYASRNVEVFGSASRQFILSAWVKFNGGDGTRQVIFQGWNAANVQVGFELTRESNNKIRLLGNAGNAFSMTSTGTYLAGSGWHHILASVNLAGTVGWLYIDDVDALSGGGSFNNTNILWTNPGFVTTFGADHLGNDKANMCLSQFFFQVAVTGTAFLDFSSSTNRRLFDTITHPIDLGATGSNPTGQQPQWYLPTGDANFNRGYKGASFTQSGTFSACTDGP